MLIPNKEEPYEDYCFNEQLLGQYSIISKGKKYIIQIGHDYIYKSLLCCFIYRYQKKYSWGVYVCHKFLDLDNAGCVDEFYSKRFTDP